jgi:hypothetical protein
MKKWPLSIPMPEIVRLLGPTVLPIKRLVEIMREEDLVDENSPRGIAAYEAQFHYQAYLDAFKLPPETPSLGRMTEHAKWVAENGGSGE